MAYFLCFLNLEDIRNAEILNNIVCKVLAIKQEAHLAGFLR